MFKVLLLALFLSPAGVSRAAEGLPAEAKEVLAETQGVIVAAETPVETPAPETATAKKEDLKESEIPLNLEKRQSVAAEGSPLLRFAFGLVVLGLMAGGAYVWMRRKARPGPRQNAPQIKVLTQHWLGQKKSLAIVRVAGESILIGVTDQNISMIKSLSLLDDEVPEEAPTQFNSVLGQAQMRGERAEEPTDGEEFQMSGLNQIKDVVSRRLKGMRSLE
ncbi:MAG: flagellar biosynthetic protein FliO [Bdellovibrionaceae bacterium]|nr:flagellar biosynthetic protein FliO [Pseudobdellovibrionaceae bacterium]MBX3034370.1 flagellar biosynthetic protein FliO [Pseudobdellovibrionaceae bacterium]